MNKSYILAGLALLVILCFCCCGKPGTSTVQPPSTNPGQTATPEGPFIVGYATYWDSTLPNPDLLTHINYAFAHIKDDFKSLDIKTPSRLAKIAALKKQNPKLKVMLSVGGWGAGNFSEMAADAANRKHFCNDCLAAVQEYNLDGIDLDWEYPTSSMADISSSPADTKNFTQLVKDLRTVLGKDKLITMASSADAKYVDFKSVAPYLDFVNIMTYDMGNPPYHNAALYNSSKTKLSCDASVKLHIAAGVPAGKIVMGIPFYGHGNGTDCDDYMDFNEISYDGFTRMWDEKAKVPYLVNAQGTLVLSYDDEESVGLKADYIRDKGLLGAMYWNIEADDASWTLSNAIASRLGLLQQ